MLSIRPRPQSAIVSRNAIFDGIKKGNFRQVCKSLEEFATQSSSSPFLKFENYIEVNDINNNNLGTDNKNNNNNNNNNNLGTDNKNNNNNENENENEFQQQEQEEEEKKKLIGESEEFSKLEEQFYESLIPRDAIKMTTLFRSCSVGNVEITKEILGFYTKQETFWNEKKEEFLNQIFCSNKREKTNDLIIDEEDNNNNNAVVEVEGKENLEEMQQQKKNNSLSKSNVVDIILTANLVPIKKKSPPSPLSRLIFEPPQPLWHKAVDLDQSMLAAALAPNATKKKHLEIVVMLLVKYHASAEAKCDVNGFTILHACAAKGWMRSITQIIRKIGFSHSEQKENQTENATTTFSSSTTQNKNNNNNNNNNSNSNNSRTSKINVRDRIQHSTALHLCCAHGYDKVAFLLLVNGADISALNIDGMSVLHVAVVNHQYKIVKLLLSYSASLQQQQQHHHHHHNNNNNNEKPLLDLNTTASSETHNGNSPLHDSILLRDWKMTKLLLASSSPSSLETESSGLCFEFHDNNDDESESDNENENSNNNAFVSSPSISASLNLRSKINVNILSTKSHLPPLRFAILTGNRRAVRKLLETGASVSWIDDDGESHLHVATSLGYFNIVRRLCRNNRRFLINRNYDPCDVSLKNNRGMDAFDVAISENLNEIAAFLKILMEYDNKVKMAEEQKKERQIRKERKKKLKESISYSRKNNNNNKNRVPVVDEDDHDDGEETIILEEFLDDDDDEEEEEEIVEEKHDEEHNNNNEEDED